jgi:hypothetical protein
MGDQRFPSVQSWELSGGRNFEIAIEEARSRAKELVRSHATKWEREVELGVSWPGYTDSLRSKLFSRQLGADQHEFRRNDLFGSPKRRVEYVVSDFQAAVLGEVSHRLGGLDPPNARWRDLSVNGIASAILRVPEASKNGRQAEASHESPPSLPL